MNKKISLRLLILPAILIRPVLRILAALWILAALLIFPVLPGIAGSHPAASGSMQGPGIVQKASANEGSDPKIITHRIPSPYQADSTTIRVLLPDKMLEGSSYRVLYVLPAAQQGNYRFGDGLLEVAKYGFHNQYRLICVAPEFVQMSWYLDHGSNPEQQDERHFLKTVLPFIDRHYPTMKSKEGRLLIGFSKSGWGAFSLLLRHPEMFDKATGWDIGIRIDAGPMAEEERSERIQRLFGDVATFEEYRISNLLKESGDQLGDRERLFYYNTEGRRGPGGAEIHRLMVELGIPHRYLYEKHRTHRWDSGWIPEAVKFVAGD